MMNVITIAVLVLLIATILTAAGFLVAMARHDRPHHGATGMYVLLGPGTVLTFAYIALAA